MEILILGVFITVLVLGEYRHAQDRKEAKELAINQQNQYKELVLDHQKTVRELLEIVRFRSGIKPDSVPPAVDSDDNSNTSKPLGYMGRISANEQKIIAETSGS